MCLKVKRILLQDWRLQAQERWQSSHQPSDIKDIPGDISTYSALKASLGEEITGQAPAGAVLVAVFEMRQRLCVEDGEGLLVQTHLLFCHAQRQGDHWRKHKALLQLQLHLSTWKILSKHTSSWLSQGARPESWDQLSPTSSPQGALTSSHSASQVKICKCRALSSVSALPGRSTSIPKHRHHSTQCINTGQRDAQGLL